MLGKIWSQLREGTREQPKQAEATFERRGHLEDSSGSGWSQALWLIRLRASPVDTKQDGSGSVNTRSYWSDHPADRVQGYCSTGRVAGDDLERRKHTGRVPSSVWSCVQASRWALNCGCAGQTPSSPAEAKELDEAAIRCREGRAWS